MKTLRSLTYRKIHFGVFDRDINGSPADRIEASVDPDQRGGIVSVTRRAVVGLAVSILALSAQAGQNEPNTTVLTTAAPSVVAVPDGVVNAPHILAVNTINNPAGGNRNRDIPMPLARQSQAETFLDKLGIADPKVRALIKSGKSSDIAKFVGKDLMEFGNTIIKLHKEYIACVLADEITAALKGTAHEIIVPSIMLSTKDGIPEAQSDTLEEKHPDLFAKYMEWHAAFLKEQIGYAQEIVRVQANTKRIEELTALFRQMNAQNAGLLKPKI